MMLIGIWDPGEIEGRRDGGLMFRAQGPGRLPGGIIEGLKW